MKYLYFIISPVWGFLSSLKNLKERDSRIVLFLFCLCFGLCFTVNNVRTEGSMDGISMRIEFESFRNTSLPQFVDYLKEYFEFDTGAPDIYIDTISFIVGSFTNNYHVFFLVLAIVFAFFQIKSLKYFTTEDNYTSSFVCIILLFLFLWNNIYNINGARFWTAAWIAIYSLFKICYDKKYLYAILLLSTILIHASFAIVCIIFIIGFLTRSLSKTWRILFYISWIFSVFASDFSLFSLPNIDLPFWVSKKMEYYTDSDYINNIGTGSGFYWVSNIFRSFSKNLIEFLILLLCINISEFKNEKSKPVVAMTIIIATFANFLMIIPTVGNRLFMLNYTLVAYSFLVLFVDYKYKKIVYLLPFAWFMNLFYLSRDVIAVLDWGFVLSPIISVFRFLAL